MLSVCQVESKLHEGRDFVLTLSLLSFSPLSAQGASLPYREEKKIGFQETFLFQFSFGEKQ